VDPELHGCEHPHVCAHRRIAVLIRSNADEASVLAAAIRTAIDNRGRLTLIQIVKPPPATLAFCGLSPGQVLADSLTHEERYLRELATNLPAEIGCTTILRTGRVCSELLSILSGGEHDALYLRANRLETSSTFALVAKLRRHLSLDIVTCSSPPPVLAQMQATDFRWSQASSGPASAVSSEPLGGVLSP
jgi:hypothetical protein